ncbi:DUF2760 domain-containing protein [Aromatoleum bremense]|uniref:DUF2760 domain-containing protein n=1 Tax=Aromatoleum bremense TaxID=76115 RepID=A0ABX1NXS9_9RHOO|nr:DUF2760 domain-containing protein [Aromatoleum bremense]NMG16477.1 DUF2760 domain-containing protein [Aromatoleum bremense]QTQ31241.1 putative protein DUF2760 [Aromatoleum bremense]
MAQTPPSFMRRLSLAFGAFFAILSKPDFAAQVMRLRAGADVAAPAAPAPDVRPLREVPHEAALQLLGMLQREARLIDFVEEDIAAYSDADVGGAARLVHAGCRKVMREHFSIEPVCADAEGSRVTLADGFDAAAIRLTGNVVGKPPFTGTISHRGWRVTDARLPKLAEHHDATIIAQAEVEL